MPKKPAEKPYPKVVVESLLGKLHADISAAEPWLEQAPPADYVLVHEQLRLVKAVQNFVRERSLA